MISLVIPTYNEATVIQETLRRAAIALQASGEEFELIVVDDSSADGTAAQAESMAADLPVRVLKRPARLGLATAVLDGWSIARGEVLGVMDADLQHPPEVLTPLASTIYKEGADLAVGSRYVPGGGTSDWTWWRRLISRTASHMAATVLPLRLATVGDPMSGVFLVRVSVVHDAKLNPMGYKILLEVIAKANYRRVKEVPYIFQERKHGGSKLGPRQYLEYLLHLGRLAFATGQLAAWMRYGAVALVGAIADIGLVYVLSQGADWPVFGAVPAAIALALLCNFVGNDLFTFSSSHVRIPAPFDRGLAPSIRHPEASDGSQQPSTVHPSGNWSARLARYGRVCLPGAILNAVVTLALISMGSGVLISAIAGVAAGGAVNLLFSIPAIWRSWVP